MNKSILFFYFFILYISSCVSIPLDTVNSSISNSSKITNNSTNVSSTITATTISYSSDFLIVPTNNEQDEEVRAARVVESNLALPPPQQQQHHATTTTPFMDEQAAPKFPDDESNSSNNTADQRPDQQQKLNKNIIAGIVGASGAGMVAMIAVGILVWHNTRRYRQQPSNNNTNSLKGGGSDDEHKSPILFSLPGEPMIAATTTAAAENSYFHEWDQHHQQQSISKFPSSTYSALFTHDTNDGTAATTTTALQTNNHHEDEWSSDTGSSESMSIRNLSTYDSVEVNSTITASTIKQQQQAGLSARPTPSATTTIPISITSSHQSAMYSQVLNRPQQQQEKELDALDKDPKHSLSLVNRKLLHYPARFRHGYANTSTKISDKIDNNNHVNVDNTNNEETNDFQNDNGVILYSLFHLFYPNEAYLDEVYAETTEEQQEEFDRTRQHFVTPFDLPASRFLPLPNCPFQLVTRQSILDDPEKRQGVHEIP